MTAIMRANWTTSRVLLVMVLLVAVAGVSSISLSLGGSYALEGLTVRHVTPDECWPHGHARVHHQGTLQSPVPDASGQSQDSCG